MIEEFWMKRVLALARRGRGYVHPNPMVGAIVLQDGKPVGKGFHERFGGPHAEVHALRQAGDRAAGGTLIVNLEPCCHHGKTPPCTDRILESGIRRVFIGMEDPHFLVHGKGIRRLKEAGIEVQVGILEPACRKLNAPFIKSIQKGEAHVTVKMAQTLDGFIATCDGRSRWITGEASRRTVHRIRSHHDAVLVGVGTVMKDNPSLTVRHVKGRSPHRIILDGEGKTPADAKIFQQPGKTVVAVSSKTPESVCTELEAAGAVIWHFQGENGRIDIHELLKKCVEEGWLSILVEGGSDVFTQFMRSDVVSQIIVFIAPRWFGQGVSVFNSLGIQRPEDALVFHWNRWSHRGNDLMMKGIL